MRDDVDDAPLPSFPTKIAPDFLAATVALRRALPDRISRNLLRGDSVALIFSVPSTAWCRPIYDVLVRKLASCRSVPFDSTRSNELPWPMALFVRDGTEKSSQKRDLSAVRLPGHLGIGGSVLAITADTSLLPPEVRAAADDTIVVSPVTARDLRGIVRLVTKSRRRADIDDHLASVLGPADLGIAIRPGSSPATCVARLRRIVNARSVIAGVEDVPPLEDLAGYGAAKVWGLSLIRDIAAFRRDPSTMPMTTVQRSALLCGPPGVGKTMFARALARSAGIPLVVTSYGDWSTYGSGHLNDVTAAAKLAFSEARTAATGAGGPAILFIDELDSLPNRGSLGGGVNDGWWTAMVNSLLTLTELSSPARSGLILLGATNFEKRIDPALRRPGRFDTILRLTLPDAADLAAILRSHLGDDLADADLMAIAMMAPPSSGADAARWVREARRAARDRGSPMTLDDVMAQVAPPERRPASFVLALARHEAAHALIGMKTGFGKVVSVSLIRHGSLAGHTCFDVDDDAIPNREELETQVVAILAGRAADEVFGGVPDAGSGGSRNSDLGQATAIVARVHASYGLGRTFVSLCDPDDVGDVLAADRDLRATVQADLERLYGLAKEQVVRYRKAIERVADALVLQRVLSGAEVARIVEDSERADVPRARSRRL